MKRNIINLLFAMLVVALSFSLMPATPARAAARTASVTGNWSDNATWGGAAVPVAADTVTINSGIMVTIPTGYAAAATSISINANGSATQNGLTFADGTSSLALSAGVTINAPTNASGTLFAVDAGSLTGATTLAINGGAAGMNAIFRISTGTASFSGAITPGGTVAQTQITFTGGGTLNVGGTFGAPGTFTASTGTVNYTGAAQTAMVATYNNLTISGSLAKTFATTPTVNGVLSMAGTATITVTSGAVTYGASATLQYNSTHTATTEEWLATFAATGGVIINSGNITMGAAKVFNASVPLTINSGATLTRATFLLTLNGDLINNGGTVTSTTGGVTITGTADQSIGAFTITGAGTVSMTKTAGTATFTSNVYSGGGLTLNGSGGTLDLGAGLNHTFNGTWTRTNGTLLGNSSTLNLWGTTSGTGATFTAGTSTVNYGGTIAQAVANVNYYNLAFSGAHGATSITISGAVGVAGTLTNTATFSTGNFVLTGSTFTFNGAGAQTIPSLNSRTYVNIATSGTSAATSGADLAMSGTLTVGTGTSLTTDAFTLIVAGSSNITGTLTLEGTGAKTFTGNVVINSGGVWDETGVAAIVYGGNLQNNGTTFNANTGVHTFNGTAKTISGTSAIAIPNLTITGTTTNNGALTVSTSLAGASTLTNGATGTLNYAGASITPTLTATAAGNTVNYDGAAQTVKGTTYYTLNLAGSNTKTLGAATIVSGNLTVNSGATLDMSTFLLTLNGDLVNNGGAITGSGGVTISGTATQSIDAFTTTGAISVTKAGGTATITGNVNAGSLAYTTAAMNGATVSLNPGVAMNLTTTFAMSRPGASATSGSVFAVNDGSLSCTTIALSGSTLGLRTTTLSISTGTVTASGSITSAGVDSRIIFSDAGVLNAGGAAFMATAATFTASTGTVNYNASGIQTIGLYTYNNLILSGTSAKTFPAGTTTVNNILSMEGTATATVTGTLTYGAAATLQYNKPAPSTAGGEWLATFPAAGTSTGGVLIANTGDITLNAAKVVNAPLIINPGATLDTGNFQVTFGADFHNNGTFTGGSAAIVIANTATPQSIDGFTTTGSVSMTKTAGIATFNGTVNGGAFTLNGSGGTLDLGAGFTHTFTGAWTRTDGTLLGNSSTLNIGGTTTNTAGTFTAGNSTVNYNGAGAQGIATVTFNNLTLSGSGAKTTTGATVNAILSMEGTATTAGTVATYGAAATLQYKGSALQTTGTEFPATFGGSGGVIIDNASNVNLGGSVAITNGLTLTSGAFGVGIRTLTLNGPTIAGTPTNLSTNSSSSLVFGGSSTGVNIPSSVTALNNLTINNVNGITLSSSPTISGSLTLTNGSIATGSNTLNVATSGSISGGGSATYVYGNLGKAFDTGAGQSFTFPLGDASNYTPVSMTNMSVGTSGSLTANTTPGEHSNISTSGILAAKSVNRYWTLTAGGGLVVSTCDATFNFVSADVDGTANTSSFVVRKYALGAWSVPAGGIVAGSTYTTGGGFTSFGDFAVGEPKAAPVVNAVSLYQADRTTTVTAMNPQVEYAVKVSATDVYNLSELSSVVVTIYYDAGGIYNPVNIPGSGNTQTAAIMTLTVGGSPSWSIDPSTSTTWSILSANSSQPNLSGTSGDFWFHFKPGKVATAASGKWYIYVRAIGPFSFGDNHQDNRTMNWYGEISVNTASVDFSSVAVGSDFSANPQSGISVTYISNGAYSMQVKLSSPWTGSGKMITLNAAGSPGTAEFSVKGYSTAVLGSALVVTTNYVTVNTGTQTGESGVTISTHTLWLKLGALGIPAVQYSGTIYYGIGP